MLTTTKKVVLKYDVFADGFREYVSTNGETHKIERRRLVEAKTWPPEGWTPPFTADGIAAEFFATTPPQPAPDNGDLWALCESILTAPLTPAERRPAQLRDLRGASSAV